MKKHINVMMAFQWCVFMPLMLPIGIITGAMEGIKKTFQQAATDIMDEHTELVESI